MHKLQCNFTNLTVFLYPSLVDGFPREMLLIHNLRCKTTKKNSQKADRKRGGGMLRASLTVTYPFFFGTSPKFMVRNISQLNSLSFTNPLQTKEKSMVNYYQNQDVLKPKSIQKIPNLILRKGSKY